MAKGKRVKKKQPFVDIYGVLLLVATLVMSIGYAEIVGTTVTVETRAEASAQEGVFITDIVTTENNVAVNNYLATTMDTSVKLDSPTATKKFTVTIYNKTVKPQVFIGVIKSDKMDEFDGAYNNTKISWTLGSNMIPYETILPAKDWITFDVDLGFNGQGTMPETLRSLLNFRFQEVPTIQISDIPVIENVYPNYTPTEYEFTVVNQRQDAEHGTITNGVPLTYTIAPNVPAPLTAKIYDENGQEVVANKEISISSEAKEEHTYKLKVFWDNTNPVQGAEYNSGSYAGQTLASSIKITATPTDENEKYLGYERIEEKAFEVKTAPLYFDVTTDKTTVEMNNTNNAEKMILTIKNNEGLQKVNKFPVEYKLSIDNSKFTLLVDGEEIGEQTITLGNTSEISQNHEIQLISKQDIELSSTENCNLSIEVTSPYALIITIPMIITDTTGPTAPIITGGSTGAYATTQTISVSEVATDVGTGIGKYQYLLNSTASTGTTATADIGSTATVTSQTFNTNYDGYYVYFRAVDKAGNVGEWSTAQQLYIDTNLPIVGLAEGVSTETTITEGDNFEVANYFTYDKNGSAGVKEVTYTVNGKIITNTSELTEGTYTITCKVTKETGATASASKTITVEEKGVYGTVYAVSDTEYHLVYNTTGNLASGYTEAQRVFTSGNLREGASYNTWSSYAKNITKAIIEEEIEPKSCKYYFGSLSSLTEIENLANINTSETVDLSYMFNACRSLVRLDLSSFNTSNVTNMSNMLSYCSSLISLDVSGFNTSKVTNMTDMFKSSTKLIYLDLSSFDTSKVTTMNSMFYSCDNLEKIYVKDSWSTESVTNSRYMFSFSDMLSGAVSYNSANANDATYANHTTGYLTYLEDGMEMPKPIYGTIYAVSDNEYHLVLNTTGNLASGYTEAQRVFTSESLRGGATSSTWSSYATKITKAIIEEEIVPRSCEYYFYNMSSLTEIENMYNLNTSNAVNLTKMFQYCRSLTSLDVSGFSTSNVTDMSYMFQYCSSLTSLDVSGFNTGNVTNMSSMFQYCSSLTSLDVSGFNTGNVTNMSSIFLTCRGLTSLDVSGFSTGNVTDMRNMFSGCSSLTSLDVSGFNTSNVTDMSAMFQSCSSLTSLDVSGFSTGNVTNMIGMFQSCSSLTSLDVSGFSTGNVTNMSGMFSGCSSLTSLDVSGFNTSNVTVMSAMFQGCSGLTSLDISGFNTSNVTVMTYMFQGCRGLTSLDISGFNTSNVTNMSSMFSGCSNLKKIYVKENWSTASVTFSTGMFSFCNALSGAVAWNLSNANDATYANYTTGYLTYKLPTEDTLLASNEGDETSESYEVTFTVPEGVNVLQISALARGNDENTSWLWVKEDGVTLIPLGCSMYDLMDETIYVSVTPGNTYTLSGITDGNVSNSSIFVYYSQPINEQTPEHDLDAPALPESDTLLASFVTFERKDITIPAGVTVIRIDQGEIDGGLSMPSDLWCNTTDNAWFHGEPRSINPCKASWCNEGGSNYVSVVPGKTYSLTNRSDGDPVYYIYYSSAINTKTPDFDENGCPGYGGDNYPVVTFEEINNGKARNSSVGEYRICR